MGLFQVLAAILHLGNVEIKDRDADSSVIPVRIKLIPQYWLSAMCMTFTTFSFLDFQLFYLDMF